MNMQDDYAVQSFERGIAAQEAGAFTWEIVPVSIFLYHLLLMPYIYLVNTIIDWSYRLKFLEEGVGHQPLLTRMKVLGR